MDDTGLLFLRPSRVRERSHGGQLLGACIPSRWDENGRRKESWGRAFFDTDADSRLEPAATQKELFDLALQVRKGTLRGGAAWIENNRPLRGQTVQTCADRFPKPAFNAVAHHSAANRAWCREADARTGIAGIFKAKSGEQRPGDSGTVVVNFSKVARS